jgi:hypothetical protein
VRDRGVVLVVFNVERPMDDGNLQALRRCVQALPGSGSDPGSGSGSGPGPGAAPAGGCDLLLVGKIKLKPSLSKSKRCVMAVSQCMWRNGFADIRVLHLAADKCNERTVLMGLQTAESAAPKEAEADEED